MHEAAIAAEILNRVQQKLATLKGSVAAGAVQILVGEFRNVDPDSLMFAFDVLKKDTKGCQFCALEIVAAAALAECRQGHKYHPEMTSAYQCPACKSGMGSLLSGEELDVIGYKFLPC